MPQMQQYNALRIRVASYAKLEFTAGSTTTIYIHTYNVIHIPNFCINTLVWGSLRLDPINFPSHFTLLHELHLDIHCCMRLPITKCYITGHCKTHWMSRWTRRSARSRGTSRSLEGVREGEREIERERER